MCPSLMGRGGGGGTPNGGVHMDKYTHSLHVQTQLGATIGNYYTCTFEGGY